MCHIHCTAHFNGLTDAMKQPQGHNRQTDNRILARQMAALVIIADGTRSAPRVYMLLSNCQNSHNPLYCKLLQICAILAK